MGTKIIQFHPLLSRRMLALLLIAGLYFPLLAWAAWAQDAQEEPLASPLKAPEREEPQGLKMGNGTLIQWGTARDDRILSASNLSCQDQKPYPDLILCLTNPGVDLGGNGPYETRLLFCNNQFCSYTVLFPPGEFEDVSRSIEKKLGAPVVNDARLILTGKYADHEWYSKNVWVSLRRQSLSHPSDRGSLQVVYLPLTTKSIEKRIDTHKAPF